MDIRPATAADIDGIAGLHAESWRRHYRGAFADEFLDGDVHADRRAVWADRLTAAESTVPAVTLVADDDGAVGGFVHVVLDDDPVWGSLVDNLHVAYGVKRRGLGRQLMARAAAATHARASSARLYLWVLEGNTDAQAFYAALGGRFAGRETSVPPGGGTIVGLRVVWAVADLAAQLAASEPERLG